MVYEMTFRLRGAPDGSEGIKRKKMLSLQRNEKICKMIERLNGKNESMCQAMLLQFVTFLYQDTFLHCRQSSGSVFSHLTPMS